jgi:4-alpha-glucanotransferase
VTATLDDALAVRERPNVPGTSLERPNWSIALPLPLETLETAPLARRIAAALDGRRP